MEQIFNEGPGKEAELVHDRDAYYEKTLLGTAYRIITFLERVVLSDNPLEFKRTS
jgi:hypothetical protein